MSSSEVLYCLDSTGGELLFDLYLAPALLFYAYIPAICLSILLGVYIFRQKTEFAVPHTLFLLTTVTFTVYLVNEIVAWISIPAAFVVFSWQMTLLIKSCLLIFSVLFFYTFTHNRPVPIRAVYLFSLLFLPIPLFVPTALNVASFDLASCEATSGWFFYYIYVLELLAIIFVLHNIRSQRNKAENAYRQTKVLGAGIISFIFFLFLSDFLSEYTGHFEYLLIGPIGMIILLSVITILIVKYRAFKTKLLATQALVVIIFALVGSQLFFEKTTAAFALTILSSVLIAIAGFYLVRSVKREVQQREEIESLATQLAKANDRLEALDKKKSEFVSIASHQLRSPLAAIMGYASMLNDGSYGALPAKAKEVTERIEHSAKSMALSVEDYLNVSRIESGTMNYTFSDFNLKNEVEHICDDLRGEGLKKGIVIYFKSSLTSQGIVHADIGKTQQIIHNLINNALKYTPKGTITVTMRDNQKKKRVYVDITDTGIGMSTKTASTIFQKFERGDNANAVNVAGTGLGLYTAQKLAEAMKGTITAGSEGEGKGSTFTLELPLML